MKLPGPRVLVALFSLAAVVLIGLVDMERTSPGPLTSVHGRDPDLAEADSCSECHGGWFSEMTESCEECHERIAQQIDAAEGLHGRLDATLAERCATCHSEHHGESFPLVNRRSFALAGVPDPKDFEHRLVGFAMEGKHLELACTKCHEHAEAAVLPEGALRFGGLESDCAKCHEDVHKGQFDLGCTACHGQQKFDVLHSDGHERVLPLIGGHELNNCRECHAKDSAHALEIVGDTGVAPPQRDCADCHESPHREPFSSGVAALVSMTRDTACVVCHQAEHTEFLQATSITSATHHAQSGFALDRPHDQAKCEQCHEPDLERFDERYPGRGADECSACHADPHGGQFDEGLFAGQECTACHERTQFAPHTFELDDHARTAMPLDGVHARTECAKCHVDPEPETPRRFRGTATLCEQCHRDAHDDYFDARTAPLTPIEHGDCARCHDTRSFTLASESSFDHARWTGFAVQGAHAQSECTLCHPRAAQCDATKRTFGRVSEAFGRYEGCVTCHDDPHQEQFDRQGLPASLAGRRDCARCHVESSFRSFPNGFDHGRWTGFALVEEHAEAACSACHAPLRKPDELGRTWRRAAGPECADCHEDPHVGQFEQRGVTDCARCHVDDAPAFSSFDHERDSRFSLGPAHTPLACDACHRVERDQDREFIRYRPLGVECADCHGAEEDLLLRRKSRRK